jgi:hypothetical protein
MTDAIKGPVLVLAADHRARGVITVERYSDYLASLRAALDHCDGILASAQPLADLANPEPCPAITALTYRSTALGWRDRYSSWTTGWWRRWAEPRPTGGRESSS